MRKMTESQRIAEKQELMKMFDNNEELVDSIIASRDGTQRIKSISFGSLPAEESERMARMINPKYQADDREDNSPNEEELSAIAAEINADTRAILKHPEMGEYQAIEHERFMKGN